MDVLALIPNVPLSMIVDHCWTPSTPINHYQPLSTTDQSPLSIIDHSTMINYQPQAMSIMVNHYWPLSTLINSTMINPYQPFSPLLKSHYQPLVAYYHLLSSLMNSCHPLSTAISYCWTLDLGCLVPRLGLVPPLPWRPSSMLCWASGTGDPLASRVSQWGVRTWCHLAIA